MRKIAVVGWLALVFVLCSGTAFAVSGDATSVNAFRQANGLPALRANPAMVRLARAHADDMARREAMDHSGFMEYRAAAGARAENVAYGCADTACAIRQWINSSGHRANMLLTDVRSYGLASARSRSGQRYWTLVLGR